jgi:hypothetical protein
VRESLLIGSKHSSQKKAWMADATPGTNQGVQSTGNNVPRCHDLCTNVHKTHTEARILRHNRQVARLKATDIEHHNHHNHSRKGRAAPGTSHSLGKIVCAPTEHTRRHASVSMLWRIRGAMAHHNCHCIAWPCVARSTCKCTQVQGCPARAHSACLHARTVAVLSCGSLCLAALSCRCSTSVVLLSCWCSTSLVLLVVCGGCTLFVAPCACVCSDYVRFPREPCPSLE